MGYDGCREMDVLGKLGWNFGHQAWASIGLMAWEILPNRFVRLAWPQVAWVSCFSKLHWLKTR